MNASQMKLELKLAKMNSHFQIAIITEKQLVTAVACDCFICHMAIKEMFSQLYDEYSPITPKIGFFYLN